MRKNKAVRLVFDTNVFISAYLAGKFEGVAQLVFRHDVFIYTCDELLEELERNFNDLRIRKLLKDSPESIIANIKKITRHTTIDLRFDRAADLKDNFLFDLAYSVKAGFLVTFEKKLQNMKHVGEIEIVSPSALFQMLGEKW